MRVHQEPQGNPLKISSVMRDVRQEALDPSYFQSKADYHFALGNVLSLNGLSSEAIENYKLALLYDPHSSMVKIKLAMEFIKQGQFFEALKDVKEAIAMDPYSIEAHLLLGGIYFLMKEYGKAEKSYLHILTLSPEEAEASLSLGSVLAKQKKYNKSLRILQKVAKNPDLDVSGVAYYHMGRVNMARGQKKKAIEDFKKSLKRKPDFVDAALSLSKVQYSLGYKRQAIKGLAHFQKVSGPSVEAAEVLSRFYESEKEYDRAYEQYKILAQSDPEQLNARIKMALISLEKKKYSRGIKELKEILALSPELDKVRFFLAATYDEIGEDKKAIQEFQKISKESPFYDEAIARLVYFYTIDGHYKKAENMALSAIQDSPNRAKLYYVYSSLVGDKDKYDVVINILAKTVQTFSENAELQFLLGLFYDKVGNKEKLISHMKRAIVLDGQFVQALNYLAYTYAEMEIELDVALDLVQKAIQLKPKDGHIRDTLGWIFYKKGDYAKAVKALESAYRLNSTESIIAEHLGDAYYRYERPQKAKKMYGKAVQLEKDAFKIQNLKLKITYLEQEVANRVFSRGLSSQPVPLSAEK